MANNDKKASWQHIFNEIKEKITDEEILKQTFYGQAENLSGDS